MAREDLLQWVQDYTRNPDLEDSGPISVIIDRLKKFEQTDSTVQSKSISRYSVTYREGVPKDIYDMLQPYVKLKTINFY